MSLSQQIELFKKLNTEPCQAQDLYNYVRIIVKDNLFGLEKVPQVTFDEDKKRLGSYIPETATKPAKINISQSNVVEFLKGYRSLYSIINTIGHELRHHLQQQCDFEKYIELNADEYYIKIKEDLKSNYKLEKDSQKFLKAFKSKVLLTNENIMRELKTIPHINEWIGGLQTIDIIKLKEKVENSYYLQHATEEDARFGGVLFTQLLLGSYRKYTQGLDQELNEILDKGEAELNKIIDHMNNVNTEYIHYQKFKTALEDLSYNEIVKIGSFKVKHQRDLAANAFYSKLLDFYAGRLIKDCTPEQLEVIFYDHLNSYFTSKNNHFKSKEEQANAVVNSKIVEQIIASDLDYKKKKEFAEYAVEYIQKNYKNYRFSENDNFINQFYINGLISAGQMKKLITCLYKDKRVYEALDILDTTSIREKDNLPTYSYVPIIKSIKNSWTIITKHIDELIEDQSVTTGKMQVAADYLNKVYADMCGFVRWTVDTYNQQTPSAADYVCRHTGFKLEYLRQYQKKLIQRNIELGGTKSQLQFDI